MNVRELTSAESKNLVALNEAGLSSALLYVTATALDKAIIDATEPMRRLFQKDGLHDYGEQEQGSENKACKPALILEDDEVIESAVSLYRPNTKAGDPRFSVRVFKRHADPNDVCAVFVHDGIFYLLNLTRSHLAELLESGAETPTISLLKKLRGHSNAIAMELLGSLKDIAAKGPIRAVTTGDTAIGASIEAALGIPINSSKNPDYKGIELKSKRQRPKGKETRATLFASVPDWTLSTLKSSTEILKAFGYWRDGDFQLYCTVGTRAPNSQGLQLVLSDVEGLLKEVSNKPSLEKVCVWTLDGLHSRLRNKHSETFWIEAESESTDGGEYFHLKSVLHTSRPSSEQFDRLLADGTVTVDHLIKMVPSGDRGNEKGPLFKIWKDRMPELFLGRPSLYSLV
jgi:hypothetical protein